MKTSRHCSGVPAADGGSKVSAHRCGTALVVGFMWMAMVDLRSGASAAELPQNLALAAVVTASSEHDQRYLARFAVDGRIPAAGGEADQEQAWCVQGSTHRDGAELTLEWAEPVGVAEVVYWGRTAWFAEECWKDYEVWADEAGAPAVTGQFQMGHGPQRIVLPQATSVRRLTLKFTSSYGGLNPGASEIQVFGATVRAGALPGFRRLPAGRPEPLDAEIEESSELVAKLAAGGLGFEQLVVIRRQELNPSHVYTYHVEGFGPGGGLYRLNASALARARRLGEAMPAPEAFLEELVASPEGQMLDCDLSYDGREILFSWRRTRAEGYQLFVVKTDGTGLRQLTGGPHHNYNACWLPDGGIVFLSTRESRFAYCWISPVGILHRMERDGTGVTRLSANIVNDFTPSVLEDGRVLYSRWEYVDKPAIPIQSLWTIRPDGTGLAGFYGNRVLSPATFMEARSIPGSGLILCVLTSHNGPCRGAIGAIDISRGNNAAAAIQNLTPEVNIGSVDLGDGNHIRGPYESPYPLDDRHFLVSKRGTLLVRDYEGTRIARIVSSGENLGFYSPQPVRPRRAPPVLSSQVGFTAASEAGMPAVAGGERSVESPTVQWATVILQDVYRGLEPHVRRGEIREICVVEEMRKAVRTDVKHRAFGFQFPVISCGATYAGKLVWGYAPVAPDGSAAFRVPAGRPIYFMAMDDRGRAVQRMRTFTHLMPGEVQGCVGCHEPRHETVALPSALRRPPHPLRPPEWGEGVGFDYAAHVQPILDAHCVQCHSGLEAPNRVDLSGDKTDFFNVSYEWLARGRKRSGEAEWESPYVSWIPTFNGMEQNILEITPKAWGSPRSRLADLLLSGHADADGAPRHRMNAGQMRTILAWIDLNVPYYGTSETAYPERPDCRQAYPPDLDQTLAEVAGRRCAGCHEDARIPRRNWTRITNPQLNEFLVAPLAREAGGSGRCGQAVFASTADHDYQAILRVFEPVLDELRVRPRMDMPGAQPAAVDRNCLGDLE